MDYEAVAARMFPEHDPAYGAKLVQAVCEAAGVPEMEKRLNDLEFEVRDGDYWQTRATQALEEGTCPVCFAADEEGHKADCPWGKDIERLEAAEKVIQAALCERKAGQALVSIEKNPEATERDYCTAVGIWWKAKEALEAALREWEAVRG